MRGLGALALSVAASAILFTLALPPHGVAFLGWIAFVPVLIALRGKRFTHGFISGILIAVIASWINASGFLLGEDVAESSPDWIYTGFILFGIVAGLALGVWAASKRLQAKPWILAAWAVLFEALLLVYLPAHLALSQSRSTSMLFTASWVGI